MLTTNLWTQAGLVNGSLGQITSIIYDTNSNPPNLPKYDVVNFKNYIGPAWDTHNPNNVPITPITQGNSTQLPLAMAWAITIHKSQGLTLENATIDIGKKERQGLTFTAVSKVKSIDGLRIHPPFSFERYCKMQNNVYIIAKKKEEARLQPLSPLQQTTQPTTWKY